MAKIFKPKQLTQIPEPAPPAKELTQAYNAGLDQGKLEAHTAFHSQIDSLQKLLTSIPQAMAEARLALQKDISTLALAIVERYFIQQEQQQDLISQQVQATLQQLNQKQSIELLLHPRDIARLQEGALDFNLGSFKNLHIVPDESLRLGGTSIRCQQGIFNASIERQIDDLKERLLEIRMVNHHV